ncbi:hypothetical protein BC629DRAFT_1439675 [Irpex lacteus]|nr:hypothetical protein BC629DRAFT_1439675 [Irpex lacteus]
MQGHGGFLQLRCPQTPPSLWQNGICVKSSQGFGDLLGVAKKQEWWVEALVSMIVAGWEALDAGVNLTMITLESNKQLPIHNLIHLHVTSVSRPPEHIQNNLMSSESALSLQFKARDQTNIKLLMITVRSSIPGHSSVRGFLTGYTGSLYNSTSTVGELAPHGMITVKSAHSSLLAFEFEDVAVNSASGLWHSKNKDRALHDLAKLDVFVVLRSNAVC